MIGIPASRLRDLSWISWALAIVVVLTSRKIWKSYRRFRAMPPSPRGLPIIGNVLQVPVSMPWLKFTEWAKEFGPIFSLNLVGQPVVVLNTFKVTNDLFERRSHLYSSRPRLIMAGEILTDGMFMAFSLYGPLWRRMRRAAHDGFSGRASEKYKPLQAKEAALAVIGMIDNPDTWEKQLKRATAAVILTAVYDWDSITEKDEPIVHRIDAVSARLSEAAAPGAYIVEFFHFLKHVPAWMAKWKREGMEWHEQETELFKSLNKDVEMKKKAEEMRSCFVGDLLDRQEQHRLSEKESAWLAGILFSAGAETTSGTLTYFMLAMAIYPETIRKAHEELDRVVGRERAPSFSDLEDLPYIQAMVKEILRWKPVAPIAMPRMIEEDDVYEGYLIPKGTMVIPNVWAMNRDPEYFPDFSEFRPERFLEGISEGSNPMGHSTYGFGRRMCVGWNFANQTLFITIASILWALIIEAEKDNNGNAIIPPKEEFVDRGVIMAPAPFKCTVTERFPGAKELLERDMPAEDR
ncbi:hypothetical protein D9613_012201 [Agrocybe pediades]|uniref:Cytochrome P450 n=1 Tax=Agrocybe pediades TaxID=84607 RepID=A0A8H4VT47_9AGAR|nr:hypothetical protein D9613_012201 [Agrocybe pediades]